MAPHTPITQLLSNSRNGDEAACTQLWEAVYDQLRAIAHLQMAEERPGRTMQPTAVVNELYLRIFDGQRVDFQNRRHFFALAAKMMRRIRIDDARKRNRLKRGGGRRSVANENEEGAPSPLDAAGVWDNDPIFILSLEEALARLEAIDPLMARVVELRFHGGMAREDIAEELGISPRTVDKYWSYARAWLARELDDEK